MDKKREERERKKRYRELLSQQEKEEINKRKREFCRQKRAAETKRERAERNQIRRNKKRLRELKMTSQELQKERKKESQRVKQSTSNIPTDLKRKKGLERVQKHRYKKCGKLKKIGIWSKMTYEQDNARKKIRNERLEEQKLVIREKLVQRENILDELRSKVNARYCDISEMDKLIKVANMLLKKDNMNASEIESYPRIVGELQRKKITKVKKDLADIFPGSYGHFRVTPGFYNFQKAYKKSDVDEKW